MKCMSCNTEIPPSWIHCIQANDCPACGNEIMNEKSKELLDEVRTAFEEMPNDPEGLAGWLLSNYQLTKVGDAEPVNFYGRTPQQSQDTRSNPNVKVNSNNKVQQFLKRTGMADQINNRPSVKDLVNKMHYDIEAEEAEIYNDYEDYDNLDVEDYEAEYERNRVRPQARQMANNWTQDGGPPPTPEEKEALREALDSMSSAGPSFHNEPLHKSTNLHPALQADRQNREYLSANISGGVGKIRRSG